MRTEISFILIFILSFSWANAQEEAKVTNVTRKDRNINDIDLLNTMYDLEKVEMDEVYMINNGQMQKVATVNSAELPKQSIETNPTQTSSTPSENITTEEVAVSGIVSNNIAKQGQSSTASTSSKSYRKMPQNKKMKYKRVRLNRSKRSFKASKKGACFSF